MLVLGGMTIVPLMLILQGMPPSAIIPVMMFVLLIGFTSCTIFTTL